MKKSVLLLIGIIYILAIATVSFFGLKIQIVGETVYINKIECINENAKVVNGEKWIIVNYYEDPDNPLAVQLEWRIYPDNATKKLVSFVYDENSTVATVNKLGTVIFKKSGAITVDIIAADGSNNVIETVKIIAKK